MQASRAFTRAITAGSKTTTRNLHITGPAPFSSLLTSNQPIAIGSNVPRLPVNATIPVADAPDTGRPVRQFNTSRSLKSVGDSSTIDFMYIPEFDPDLSSGQAQIRVPILPWLNPSAATKAAAAEVDEPVMIPTIHTVAADGTHIHAPSAMADVSDSQHFDYQGMAASAVNKLTGNVEGGSGMARQLWTGLMDDLFPKGGSPKPS